MGERITEAKRRYDPVRGQFSIWCESRDEAEEIMAMVADAAIEGGVLFSWSLD